MNDRTESEAASGEVIDGGTGNNTLYVYGTVDFTGVTISNVTEVVVNSDVTFSDDQLGTGGIVTVTGDGSSTIRLSSSDGAVVSIDLSQIDMTGIKNIDVGEGVTLVAATVAQLKAAGISVISGAGTLQVTASTGSVDLNGIALETGTTVTDAAGTSIANDTTGASILTATQVINIQAGLNAAPTAISLSSATVAENVRGETIGALSVTDPDGDTAFTLRIDDDRFEIVDFESEPTITLAITAVDAGGAAYTKTIDITVTNTDDVLEGVALIGIDADDYVGREVSNIGDVNDDGIDDVLISAPNAGDTYTGEAYVIYGNEDGWDASINLTDLDGTDGFVMNGLALSDSFGGSVSGAGDVNGDGIDDFIIGAPSADPNGNSSGSAYVVFGNKDGFGADFDLSTLDGTNGFVVNGLMATDVLGHSVAILGDVNNDGIDDILVGAYGVDTNASLAGAAYLIFGSDDGFDANFDLTTLDGTNGIVLNGGSLNDAAGFGVAAAGDVNGDGIDDFMISAAWASPNGAQSGKVFVVYGTDGDFGASFDLDDLDGTDGFIINGAGANDQLGRHIGPAIDLNNDGFDDLVMGAEEKSFSGGNSGSGGAYVIFGSATQDAVVEVSALDGTNGFFFMGGDDEDHYLGQSISNAGDINGDGIDDLIIGSNGLPDGGGGYDFGEVYIVFGSEDGFAAVMDRSDLDGTNGFIITGGNTADRIGVSVSSAGDVNGDGIDDLLIGVPYIDIEGNNAVGKTYIIFGHAGDWEAAYDMGDIVAEIMPTNTQQGSSGNITQVDLDMGFSPDTVEPDMSEASMEDYLNDEMVFNTLGDDGTFNYDYF